MEKISNVCDINLNSLSSKEKKERDYFYYLDLTNMTDNQIDTIEKIESKKLPSRAKRIVHANDVIISTVRPVQRHHGILIDPPENLLVSTGYTVLTVNEEKANPHYLYHYLSNHNSQRRMELIAGTSTSSYPSLRPEDIAELNYTQKDLAYQKEIGEILNSLDKKLKINKKEIMILEEYTQLLFHKWFIDFNFPNEIQEPYKENGGEMVLHEGKLIPKNWKIEKLKVFSDLTMGVSPKSEFYNNDSKGYPLLNGAADLTEDGIFPERYTSAASRISKQGDILLCIRATIGNIHFSDKEYALGRGVAAITVHNDKDFGLVYLAIERMIYNLKRRATGSVIKGLSKPDLENIEIVIPNDYSLLNSFQKIVNSMLTKINLLKKENLILAEKTDLLVHKYVK